MKNLFIAMFSTLCLSSYAQEHVRKTIWFQGEEIEYIQVGKTDASTNNLFITMYADYSTNNYILNNAISCMDNDANDSSMIFLKAPIELNYTEKELLFSSLMEDVLDNTDITSNCNLYLNFDTDYSDKFRIDAEDAKRLINIKRIYSMISPQVLCEAMQVSNKNTVSNKI